MDLIKMNFRRFYDYTTQFPHFTRLVNNTGLFFNPMPVVGMVTSGHMTFSKIPKLILLFMCTLGLVVDDDKKIHQEMSQNTNY